MPSLIDLLTGAAASKDQDKKAEGYLGKEAGAYDNVNTPTLNPVDLQKYSWQKDYNPNLVNQGADVSYDPSQAAKAGAVSQADSQMAGISDDPRLRDQQISSISALKELADKGGMNLSDQSNLNKIESQVNQQDKGRQDAIMQNMQERGAGGSGNELLQRLTSSQAATDRASTSSQDVAAQAQQRALQAMMQGGQLSGQMRAQDFGEAADKAKAQDAINNFNAANATRNNQFNASAETSNNQFNAGNDLRNKQQNRATDLGVQEGNANNSNSAQKFNIEGHQGLDNANTDIGNRQTMYNAGLPQQNFNNNLNLASHKSGAANSGVQYYGGQSNQNREGMKQGVAGAAQLGGAAYNKWGGSGGTDAGTAGTYAGDGGAGGAGDAMAGGADAADMGTAAEGAEMVAAHGGFVPGHARVPGDSLLNDTVKARLSPGELVVDRDSLAKAPPAAKSFLSHVGSHPIGSPIRPEHLGHFLQGLNPKQSMHQDSEFSLGDKSYNPDSGNSPDLDETIAKLSALGLLSKQGNS